MYKKDIRALYLSRRKFFTPSSVKKQSTLLINAMEYLPIWHFKYFHLFLSIPGKSEVQTVQIRDMLYAKKKQVVVPKIVGPGLLEHFLLTPDTELAVNKWGIPEPVSGPKISPKDIEVVFVPLLAFDKSGNRVGYGKGFYDRFLAQCKTQVVKIGLSLFEAEEKITDIDERDVPLNYCITPSQTYCFESSDEG